MSNDGNLTESPTELAIRLRRAEEQIGHLTTVNLELARKLAESELNPVTNLPIRRPFERALANAITETLADVRSVQFMTGTHPGLLDRDSAREINWVVVITDLSYLNFWNDSYGHAVGDQALASFANTIRMYLNDDIRAFHCGGDEFAIIAKGKQKPIATMLKESIEAYRMMRITEGAILEPGADYGAVTAIEALWAYGSLVNRRQELRATDGRKLITMIKQLILDIGDARCYYNKVMARVLLLAELYVIPGQARYLEAAKYLYKGGHFMPEDVELLAVIQDPVEKYMILQQTASRKYMRRLTNHERRIEALNGLDGADDLFQETVIKAALRLDPFGPKPK